MCTMLPFHSHLIHNLISSVWDDCLSVYRDSQFLNEWPFHMIASLFFFRLPLLPMDKREQEQGHFDAVKMNEVEK